MSAAEFPFSRREWRAVWRASRAVTNATLADDRVLRSSHFAELQRVLEDLRVARGDHPILLETEADFSDENVAARSLYLKAIELALRLGLPTYTARISLARLLLDAFGMTADAHLQLLACRDEVGAAADDSEQKQWRALMDRASCVPDDTRGRVNWTAEPAQPAESALPLDRDGAVKAR